MSRARPQAPNICYIVAYLPNGFMKTANPHTVKKLVDTGTRSDIMLSWVIPCVTLGFAILTKENIIMHMVTETGIRFYHGVMEFLFPGSTTRLRPPRIPDKVRVSTVQVSPDDVAHVVNSMIASHIVAQDNQTIERLKREVRARHTRMFELQRKQQHLRHQYGVEI